MKGNEIALKPTYWASVSGGKDSLYCQFSITFADYKQEQRLYDYINDRIKELKGVDVHA